MPPPPPPPLLSQLDPAAVPPSPSLSAINDAIAGRPRPSASEAGGSSVAGSSTPRVNGYSFVDEEPTIAELRQARLLLNAHNASSSASSASSVAGGGGSIAGGEVAAANPFKIGEQSRREALHHRMVDRVAQKNRAMSRAPSASPAAVAAAAGRLGTPNSPFARTPVRGGGAGGVGSLTPAAQRLWSRIGTPAAAGGAATPFGETARANKTPLDIRWTPVPKAAAAKKAEKEP
jgi:protein DGCR14